MALGQVSTFPYYVQPTVAASVGDNNKRKQDNELANESAQNEINSKAAQEAFFKRIELETIKAENNAVIENLRTQEEEAERAYRQFEKTKNAKGAATVDSGQNGFARWMSNAGTALWNMGKSIIGFDKDGNWDPVKCATNIGITAAAIGATCIPYVGPFIGYGLLAYGVISGAYGVYNGINKLEKAEKSGDQQKIDEAQQDICSGAFIGITSIFGLRGVGKAFRTSSATAESASAATARSNIGGKCVESVSNFGKDITVNAFKATKHASSNGTIPSLTKLRSWEKQYNKKLAQYQQNINNEIQNIDNLISRTTDNEKLALLFEKRALLTKNKMELEKFASLESKAEIDKLVASDTKTAAQQNMERLNSYSMDASGGVTLPGGVVKTEQFMQFQRRMQNLQRAYDKNLKDLIKTKENMMRTFAKNPNKHRAELDGYISTADIKRSWYKPSDWLKSKEMLAIGGKNPGYTYKFIGSGNLEGGLSFEDFASDRNNIFSAVRYYFEGDKLVKIAQASYLKNGNEIAAYEKSVINITEFSTTADQKYLSLPAELKDKTKRDKEKKK